MTNCSYCTQFEQNKQHRDKQTIVLVVGNTHADCMGMEDMLHRVGMCQFATLTTRPFSECVSWMRRQTCEGFLVLRAPLQFSKDWQGMAHLKSIMKEKEPLYLLHYISILGLPNGLGSRVVAYDSRAFYLRKSYLEQMERSFDSTSWLVWDYCITYGPARASYPQLVYKHADDQLTNDPFVQNIMTLISLIFVPLVLFMIVIFLTSYLLRSRLFLFVFSVATCIYVVTFLWNLYLDSDRQSSSSPPPPSCSPSLVDPSSSVSQHHDAHNGPVGLASS